MSKHCFSGTRSYCAALCGCHDAVTSCIGASNDCRRVMLNRLPKLAAVVCGTGGRCVTGPWCVMVVSMNTGEPSTAP